jgi:prolipoprotein diacylglyceryl transferase
MAIILELLLFQLSNISLPGNKISSFFNKENFMYPDVSYFFDDIFGFSPDNWTSIFKTYEIFLFIGILVASLVFERELSKKLEIISKNGDVFTLPHNFRNNVLFIVAIAGIIGSKILAIIEKHEIFFSYNIFDFIFKYTGISFYGGLIGAAIALILFFRAKKINILSALDASAPAILIGYSIGRLGCHFSGDGDWGVVADPKPESWFFPDWLWSYNFPHNVANKGQWIEGCNFKYCHVLANPVFPTSFYESIICFTLFLLILAIKNWNIRIQGMSFSIYLILSGFERFFIEFIRLNKKYDYFGMLLSQAQFISIALILIGIVSFFCCVFHKKL